MAADPVRATALADLFMEELREAHTPEQFTEVVAAGLDELYFDHNEIMHDALKAMGLSMWDARGDVVDETVELWNAAVDILNKRHPDTRTQ